MLFAVGGTAILHLGSRVFSTWLLSRRTTSGIRASQVRRGIIWRFEGHRLLIWWRSCVDLRSALGLFVGSCVDLRIAREVLNESLEE